MNQNKKISKKHIGVGITVAAAVAAAAVGGTAYYQHDKAVKEEEARIDGLKAQAEAVDEEISAINDDLTLSDEEAVGKASSAYDALSEEAKTYVKNKSELDSKENTIDTLKAEDEKAKAEASSVDDLIASIGNVTLDSGEKITEAQNAYDALSDQAKTYVKNQGTLTDNEKKYQDLVTAKAEADKAAAEAAARAQAEKQAAAKKTAESAKASSGRNYSKTSSGSSSSSKSTPSGKSNTSASAGNTDNLSTKRTANSDLTIAVSQWTDPMDGEVYNLNVVGGFTPESNIRHAEHHHFTLDE